LLEKEEHETSKEDNLDLIRAIAVCMVVVYLGAIMSPVTAV
jgi:peptidoglycan/LPS O-acetylase OafA/YrhL